MSLQTSMRLIDEDLWKECYPIMEMLFRNSLICPELGFIINGLEKGTRYKISISLRRVDNIRYTINSDKNNWIVSKKRKALPAHRYKEYEHVGGVKSGEEWMERPIMFKKLKLSTNVKDEVEENVFFVHTMHKYVLTMIEVDNGNRKTWIQMDIAQFILVTEYQHKDIGNWKMEL